MVKCNDCNSRVDLRLFWSKLQNVEIRTVIDDRELIK